MDDGKYGFKMFFCDIIREVYELGIKQRNDIV